MKGALRVVVLVSGCSSVAAWIGEGGQEKIVDDDADEQRLDERDVRAEIARDGWTDVDEVEAG